MRSNLHRLRWEKPLRDEILASPATFRAEVEVQDLRGPVSLNVHGDAFQVNRFAPGRTRPHPWSRRTRRN